jgi:hypothetical protein
MSLIRYGPERPAVIRASDGRRRVVLVVPRQRAPVDSWFTAVPFGIFFCRHSIQSRGFSMPTRRPPTRRSNIRTSTLACLAWVSVLGTAHADEEPLLLSHLPAGEGLVARLWNKSPEVLAARLRAEQAKAEEDRASRLPNPVLDASWNTPARGGR